VSNCVRADAQPGRTHGHPHGRRFSPAPTFGIDDVIPLASEGTVPLSSSSGIEEAHESEALLASFFTHRWNAALRGAADATRTGSSPSTRPSNTPAR
jgi:hypothetical protein